MTFSGFREVAFRGLEEPVRLKAERLWCRPVTFVLVSRAAIGISVL